MPGDPFQRVSIGDPHVPNAELQNTLIETALRSRRGWKLGASPASLITPQGLISMANDSNADVDRFNVLGINDILWGPTDNLAEFLNNTCLMGVTPTLAGFKGLFAITAEPIAKNAIGRAWITSWCPARVFIHSTSDPTADVSDGNSAYLESGSDGSAQLLWVGDSEGLTPDVRWAIIRFGGGGAANLPIPQYQYQILQGVAQRVPGYDWARLHAAL